MDKHFFLLKANKIWFIAFVCIWGAIFNDSAGAIDSNPSDITKQDIQKMLTPEEKRWLSKHRTIRIAGPKAFPPFHYYEKNGSLKGMSSDYIHFIFKCLDIQPDIRSNLEWGNVLGGVEERKIDLISCAAKTMEREGYLGFTKPYLSFPLVIITKINAPFTGGFGDLHGRKVAFIKKAAAYEWVQRDKISLDPYFVKTPLDGLQAVSLGRAEAHIDNLATATYLIQKYGLANLKIAAPISHGNYDLYIAVRKDWPELVSIINKIFAAMTPQQHLTIRNRWLSLTYEYGISKAGAIKWILGISGFAILILAVILVWNRRLSREIGERKRAEKKLKESEKRFRNLYNNALVGLFRTRICDGKLIQINQKYAAIAGYDSIRECQQMFIASDHYADPKVRKQMLDKIIQNGEVKDVEAEIINKNGRHIWISFSARIYPEDDYIEGVLVDISHRKHLEAQLQQTQKIESIGTLAGGIAHDFNNILSIIVGNVELAFDDIPESNPAHSNLEKIKAASFRATNIVRQLLNFSRKTPQKLQPMDIALVIKDALRLLRSTIPTTIEICQDIRVSDEIILADSTQIHQILMNLCINASQAMEQTGGNLTINVGKVMLDNKSLKEYPDLECGKHIKVTVSDTGPGIDPKIMDRVFDPYFTTKEIGKGSGMGLAVVLGIVKSHGAAIIVDSKLGKGVTFSLFFPIVTDNPEKEADIIRELSRGSEAILFVDDEEPIRDMTQKILKRFGYRVESTLNPEDALKLFKSKPDYFDLVITDMTMPQMTGARLSEMLMEIRSDIPVIICTGHSSLMDETKAKQLGIAAYVMKPVSMDEIATIIRTVLDH